MHTSNFKVVGFAEETAIEELVALGLRHGVPVADDLGSGALVDLPVLPGRAGGRRVSLQAGVDRGHASAVTSCWGDPRRASCWAGPRRSRALKRHPLARALRVDKMTLAALEGTLLLYRDPSAARRRIPTLRYLERTPAETEALAASRGTAADGAAPRPWRRNWPWSRRWPRPAAAPCRCWRSRRMR